MTKRERERRRRIGRDATGRLHLAAGDWLKSKGGNAIISEGPFIIEDAESRDDSRFYVAVKMVYAKKPPKELKRHDTARGQGPVTNSPRAERSRP